MPISTADNFFSLMQFRTIAVAEIGTSHGGSLEKGLTLVDAAADAGADAVKVQVVFAREILPPQAGLVPLPGGPVPLYQIFESLEQPVSFYAALARRAEDRKIAFFGTPFGPESMALLQSLGVGVWKVASPELNHEPLLEMLARTGQPIILSTGVSQEKDVSRAMHILTDSARQAGLPVPPIVLLHCITSYPAPESEANLMSIPALESRFGVPAGLSDHSLDPVLLPALATALGAVMVEKHLCLSRSGGGLDDPIALPPDDFARMVVALHRFAPNASRVQNGGKIFAHTPEGLAHLNYVIDQLTGEYGKTRVEAALGNGELCLAPSETANYGRTNRSIHAVAALSAGSVLTSANTAILRTEKVLRPGIPPADRHKVYGRVLLRDVAAGNGIVWADMRE